MSSYLAPNYFPTSYFASGGSSGSTSSGSGSVRDRDVYKAMMAEIEATGEFAAVQLLNAGGVLETADLNPVLGVVPSGWQEVEDSKAGILIRTVLYQIWISVKEQGWMTQFDWSDRLACLVQNHLDGWSMGGVCIPSYSILRRGMLKAANDPNSSTVVLDGQFAYAIDRSVGRSTAP